MKKLLPLMAGLLVLVISCSKDDDTTPSDNNNNPPVNTGLTVQKKNHAAVIYFGEDWCPPCGTYGGPTLDSLLDREEGDLINGIKVNSSSNNNSLNWIPGGVFFDDFDAGVFGNANAIPSMAVNNTKQPVYTNINTNVNQAITKATTFSTASVIAAIALKKTFAGDSMKVETKVKFYEAVPAGDEYRLAVFMVEDSVVASQYLSTGSPNPNPNYVHRNLVRVANSTTYTGLTVNNGAAVAKNKEFSKTYKMYVKSTYNKSHLKAVAILWKMGGTPPTVINSQLAK